MKPNLHSYSTAFGYEAVEVALPTMAFPRENGELTMEYAGTKMTKLSLNLISPRRKSAWRRLCDVSL